MAISNSSVALKRAISTEDANVADGVNLKNSCLKL